MNLKAIGIADAFKIKDFTLNNKDFRKSKFFVGEKTLSFDEITPEILKSNLEGCSKLFYGNNFESANRFENSIGNWFHIKNDNDKKITKSLFKTPGNYVETTYYFNSGYVDEMNVKGHRYVQYRKNPDNEFVFMSEERPDGNMYIINKWDDGRIESKLINNENSPDFNPDNWLSYTVVHDKNGKLIQLKEEYMFKENVIVE